MWPWNWLQWPLLICPLCFLVCEWVCVCGGECIIYSSKHLIQIVVSLSFLQIEWALLIRRKTCQHLIEDVIVPLRFGLWMETQTHTHMSCINQRHTYSIHIQRFWSVVVLKLEYTGNAAAKKTWRLSEWWSDRVPHVWHLMLPLALQSPLSHHDSVVRRLQPDLHCVCVCEFFTWKTMRDFSNRYWDVMAPLITPLVDETHTHTHTHRVSPS